MSLIERYDQGAEPYRELWAPVLLRAALPLVQELADEPAHRVLDVATGVGALLPHLAAAFPGAFVLGVDRSHGMLRLAPARFGRALMDARELAVRSASLDRALVVFMLFHLEDPWTALRETRRVLRQGGRIGTLTWGGELESPATRIWSEGLDRHGAIDPDPATTARHEAVDSPEKMLELLRRVGFESPRSWQGDLVHRIDADHLAGLRTQLGSSKARFDSLSPQAAAAFLADVRERLQKLGPEDFIARGKVVYATAST